MHIAKVDVVGVASAQVGMPDNTQLGLLKSQPGKEGQLVQFFIDAGCHIRLPVFGLEVIERNVAPLVFHVPTLPVIIAMVPGSQRHT